MKNINLFVVLVVILIGESSMISAKEGKMSPKPQPPLQISIAPARPGVTPETIKAGDVVDFKVVASSMIDTMEMRIQVKLADGVELVSGDLSWTGPAMKNEIRTLPITIKVPLQGNGSVKAKLSITLSEGSEFATSSEFALGGNNKPKPESARPVKKDSRGHGVVEYR